MDSRLRHDALLYDSDAEFAERMAPFLGAALEAGGAAIAVTKRGNHAILREAMGDAAESVAFRDSDDFYTRPIDALAGYEATLRDLRDRGAPAIAVIGEVQFGPTEPEWNEWIAYEAVLNRSFERHNAWIVCPYDTRALHDRILESAVHTHPAVHGDERAPTEDFADPADVARALTPIVAPIETLRSVPPGGDAEALRERLAAEVAAAGLPPATAIDLLLAANEIAVNAWEHGGGVRELRVGQIAGSFVCEIADSGPGIDDPLAGFIPPAEGGRGGGLWLARRLSSRLELVPDPGGLTVRLWA
jgi:anti-sigma regulatory factor (Ser/Thr protein kinase)